MSEHPIRVLHTSDWHLGRSLHDCPRDDEFDQFLQWLLDTIDAEKIDVLLVAGDIFDTSNPPHAAQQRYYNFCTKLAQTRCRHTVVISGNHDSTSFIDVPAAMLSCLNIHVIGQPRFGIGKSGSPKDEICILKDTDGTDALIVAAVPFLSDSDVRYSADGEDTATKEQKVIAGVAEHYRLVAEECERIRAGRNIPVIAMGHLFVNGGKMVEDDGVRMTYVGSLGGVRASIFNSTFDYVALGHLHVPQPVAGFAHIRYSGSPLAMGFGEAGQQKSACLIEFNGRTPAISVLEIPEFRRIARIVGDQKQIESQLHQLMQANHEVYVSVIYTGNTEIDSVMSIVDEIVGDSDIVRCLYTQNLYQPESSETTEPDAIPHMTLDDLNEITVFRRLLDIRNPSMPAENRQQLIDTFNELLIMVQEQN